jgi:hypothetical protein
VTETKRCGGHKGHWECADEFPDHIIPISEFNKQQEGKYGVGARCKKCHRYSVSKSHYENRPKHPVTGQWKMDWKRARAVNLGGRRGTPDWQSYLNRAEELWLADTKVVDIQPRLKSEFGQSTPMTKRETVKVEGEAVPEGWVYVVRNPDVPSVIKIGKTFPNGIGHIMSSARRFGRSELVDKFWFEEAYKAEQSIHTLLNRFNLRTLGHTDCGTELFKCTIEEAMDAITKVQSENDRPSVAVGG